MIILWQKRPFPLEFFLLHIPVDKKENPVYLQSRELILGSTRTSDTGGTDCLKPSNFVHDQQRGQSQLTKFY